MDNKTREVSPGKAPADIEIKENLPEMAELRKTVKSEEKKALEILLGLDETQVMAESPAGAAAEPSLTERAKALRNFLTYLAEKEVDNGTEAGAESGNAADAFISTYRQSTERA